MNICYHNTSHTAFKRVLIAISAITTRRTPSPQAAVYDYRQGGVQTTYDLDLAKLQSSANAMAALDNPPFGQRSGHPLHLFLKQLHVGTVVERRQHPNRGNGNRPHHRIEHTLSISRAITIRPITPRRSQRMR